MTAPKTGPLTQADLRAIWESTSDPGFTGPLEQAGEGQGFEAYTQAWAQQERVSQAVDTTTQAMFVLPWSGQSGPPAAGPQRATVTLSLARAGRLNLPLVIAAGTLVEEVITDWSFSGGVPVHTGRRYALSAAVVFPPGVQGPLTVAAVAERPGYGYNNPQPGTIRFVVQPGSGYTNTNATVRGQAYPGGPVSPTALSLAFIDAANDADAFLPDHVGQYLLFTAGANAGTVARAISYAAARPLAVPPTGGTLGLELEQSLLSLAGHFAGTFRPGEALEFFDHLGVASGFGTMLGTELDAVGGALRLVVVKKSGAVLVDAANLGAAKVVGLVSGATATVDQQLANVDFTLEVDAAAWRVLDWVEDWGLAVSNAAQPAGGVAGMLDVLGKERKIFRAPGEGDESYRKRVASIADVVTPNAVRRAIARVLGAGAKFCMREVGSALLPGVYYDVPDDITGIVPDFYDNCVVLFPGTLGAPFFNPLTRGAEKCRYVSAGGALKGEGWFQAFLAPSNDLVMSVSGLEQVKASDFAAGDQVIGEKSGGVWNVTGVVVPASNVEFRFHRLLDYTEMRAFFLVGLTPTDAGEFGFAYDVGPYDFFDASPFLDFYDGFPVDFAALARQVYAAIGTVKAGGVGYDLYEVNEPCQ